MYSSYLYKSSANYMENILRRANVIDGCVCVPRAWRLAGRDIGEMLSSCGVVLRNWEWMSLSKMRYAGI